ncbi:hypothetical protein AJ79_05756 [Helicocarpus griseus UAMH5409]|uniref:Uncharacterized protein n=1 Tax=Helicocarpus griseus UAMH5409 TaxID=1447875 RepID=A0A2B7XKX5_9EURO|nr:hypothetical protein AJ79_05756 [Helicocarpus griseus UAMH5409]
MSLLAQNWVLVTGAPANGFLNQINSTNGIKTEPALSDYRVLSGCLMKIWSLLIARKNRKRDDALAILRILLAQISCPEDGQSASQSVKGRYEERARRGSLLLDECVELLIANSRERKGVVIVVDALDECSDYDALLEALRTVSNGASNVKLLFSSRMGVPVYKYFNNCQQELIIEQASQDVKMFIETEINCRRRPSYMTPELSAELLATLSNLSGGMFRWAELQLELSLRKRRRILHIKDFKEKLGKLKRNPGLSTLNQAYDDIYEMNTADQPHSRALAKKTLNCVLYSFEPLDISALVQAVAIEQDGSLDLANIHEDYVLDICSNFILKDRAGKVHLSHVSVREYLVQRCSSDGRIHEFYPAQGHEILAMAASPEMLFRLYAVCFWPYHCEELTTRSEGIFGRIFSQFASSRGKISNWFEFVARISESHTADEWTKIRSAIASSHDICYLASIFGFNELLDDPNILNTANVDLPNEQSETCLYLASQNMKSQTIRRLVSKGADVDKTSGLFHTPLLMAITMGREDVIRTLLECGADANRRYDSELSYPSPLVIACHLDSIEIVKVLLEFKADVNSSYEFNKQTFSPMQVALQYKSLDVANLLLDHGAKVSAPPEYRDDTLRYAIHTGNYQIIKSILEKDADPNARGSSNPAQYPLYAAADIALEDIVTLLLEFGADANAMFSTLLSRAISATVRQRSSRLSIPITQLGQFLDFSLQSGADKEASELGDSIYGVAFEGRVDVMNLLLNKGVNIHNVRGYGQTVLHAAAEKCRLDMIKLLLGKGVDVNVNGPKGTALHLARNSIKALVAKLMDLIEQDSILQVLGFEGCRYRFERQIQEDEHIVGLLLKAGAVDKPSEEKCQRDNGVCAPLPSDPLMDELYIYLKEGKP